MIEAYPPPASDGFYTTRLRTVYPREQSYEFSEFSGQIHINDPAWGSETIGELPGDEVFLELYRHPAIQRLAAIEQLTLPRQFTTIPETSGFTRWEHAWGSVVFTRKMIQKAEERGRRFTHQEKTELQLRTFLSDVGHSAFSHLGDWLRQGFDGTEDHHDLTLAEYLEVSGVNETLRRHQIDPGKVIFPKGKSDWIECDAPDLCVDRVDYSVREIIRWLDPQPDSEWWVSQFELSEDDQLVMHDPDIAAYFTVGFGLLTTEHWGHPIQQLQLRLFAELVTDILHTDTYMLSGTGIHPKDRLYTIDADIMRSAEHEARGRHELTKLMSDIGRSQRQDFLRRRSSDLTNLMLRLRDGDRDVLTDGTSRDIMAGESQLKLTPHNVEVIRLTYREKADSYDRQATSIDFPINRKKPRGVDPLIDKAGERTRASLQNPALADFIALQKSLLKQQYLVRLYSSPGFIADLRQNIADIRARGDWQTDQPYDSSNLREALRSIGGLALGMSPNDIR